LCLSATSPKGEGQTKRMPMCGCGWPRDSGTSQNVQGLENRPRKTIEPRAGQSATSLFDHYSQAREKNQGRRWKESRKVVASRTDILGAGVEREETTKRERDERKKGQALKLMRRQSTGGKKGHIGAKRLCSPSG